VTLNWLSSLRRRWNYWKQQKAVTRLFHRRRSRVEYSLRANKSN